jgi:hypothetical protein
MEGSKWTRQLRSSEDRLLCCALLGGPWVDAYVQRLGDLGGLAGWNQNQRVSKKVDGGRGGGAAGDLERGRCGP